MTILTFCAVGFGYVLLYSLMAIQPRDYDED
jgi:hypothetical protein